MSEQLRQVPNTIKNKPDVTESLPETSEQAWQAAENRQKTAELAKKSAGIVEESLGTRGKSMVVEMGQTQDGRALSGSVEKVDQHTGMLRVKVLSDGKPEASFIYSDFFDRAGHPQTAVIEEVPTAQGGDIMPISGQASAGVEDIRGLALNLGMGDAIYRGDETVMDQGAMDFVATTQVLKAAAVQVQAEQPPKAA